MAKRPHLSKNEIDDLDLFDALCDHLEAQRQELLETIHTEGKDSTRRFTGNLRITILERDGECFYCHINLYDDDKYHIDHVIPHSRGGRTVEQNGVLACPRCNRKKSNKVW